MDLNFNHVPGVAHTHTHSHTHLRGRGGGGQGWTAIEIGVGRHRQLASTQLAETQSVSGRRRPRPRPCVPHTPCRPENENEEGRGSKVDKFHIDPFSGNDVIAIILQSPLR